MWLNTCLNCLLFLFAYLKVYVKGLPDLYANQNNKQRPTKLSGSHFLLYPFQTIGISECLTRSVGIRFYPLGVWVVRGI